MKQKLFTFFYLLTSVNTFAQSGLIDSTFAVNGINIDKRFSSTFLAVAVQQDDKIIVGGQGGAIEGSPGSFILYRYKKDGGNDSTFGQTGMVLTGLSGAFSTVFSIVVQPDKKILATGYMNSNIGIVRYQENGVLDSSFGVNGISETDLGAGEYTHAMALQPDGKIVVTGFISKNSHDDQRAFIARFLNDGNLDASFGNGGFIIIKFDAQIKMGDVALQTDGKIVIGGTYDPALRARFFIVRFLTNGIADTSFGDQGLAISDINSSDGDGPLSSIVLQEDGKILGAGAGYGFSGDRITDMEIIRFNTNGSIDTDFGENGATFAEFGNHESLARDIILQSDGKIVIAGNTTYNFSDNNDFALARFTTTGSLDSSFGENGLQSTAITNSCIAYSMAQQKNGKIILAGDAFFSEPPLGNYCAVARYNNDPTQISITKNIKVTEGNAGNIPATFRLALNNTSALPVKVKYKTVNGTAIAGTDYIADSGVVTIKAGKTMAKITIDVIGNSMQEPNKKFYLQIGEPVNAELGALTTASCTIKNDDALRTGYNNLTLPAIKISPNPVKDVLQLQGLDANSNATVTIVNMQGNIIDASTVSNSSSYTKNIAQLHHGTYYIKIQQNEKVSTVMFMKE